MVAEGTTLLAAARDLGVAIEATCGGHGVCDKCRVTVHHMPQRACMVEVSGPLVVTVPEESRAAQHIVRKGAREMSIPLKPAVGKLYVELSPPTLDNPQGDWERLQRAVAIQHGLRDLHIDYRVLRTLPQQLRAQGWAVTVTIWNEHEVIKVEPGLVEPMIGLAIDVGTTSLAAYLCDLRSGELLESASAINPQVTYGDDVMARLTYTLTNPDGLHTLHTLIRDGLNDLITRLTHQAGFTPGDVLETVLVGNTCMHHLLLNIAPDYIGVSPFAPAIHQPVDVKAERLGLCTHPAGNVHFLSVIAGFLGADIVGCAVAEQPHRQDDLTLLIDIGTNGEMILGNCTRLVAASCATGPAFEGAQIAHGMRAAEGAIESITIDPLTWDVHYKVIGEEGWHVTTDRAAMLPRGLCGTAIIDLGWELFQAGIIDDAGRFPRSSDTGDRPLEKHYPENRLIETPQGRAFVLVPAAHSATGQAITFSVDDVQALRLAKAAMYSAARIMMRRFADTAPERVILAGAFGSTIDAFKAMAAGLFPDVDPAHIHAVGNAAGDGARICLLNVDRRAEAAAIARQVEYVVLTQEPDFDRLFAAAMNFPHAADSFPHLNEEFETARRARCARVLGQVTPFAALPVSQRLEIAATAHEIRLRRRQPVPHQEGCYLVLAGSVAINEGHTARRYDRFRWQKTAQAATRDTRLLFVPAAVLAQFKLDTA